MKKYCAYCKRPFEGQRSSRLYCSDNCKQMAYYKRHEIVAQDDDLVADSWLGEVNVNQEKSLNDNSFIKRLSALIDEEVSRRVAHAIGTFISEQNRSDKSVKPTVKKTDNVKPDFTISRNQRHQRSNEIEQDDDERDVIKENSHEGDNLNVKESDNVKFDVTVNHNRQHETVSAVELVDDESDTTETENDEANDLNVKRSDNVKSDFTVNRNRYQNQNRVTLDHDENDTKEDDNREDDDRSVKSNFTLNHNKRHENVKPKGRESDTDDNSIVDDSRDSNNFGVKNSDTVKPNFTSTGNKLNVKESVNVKKPLTEKQSFTVNENLSTSNQEIKPQSRILTNPDKEKWVYSMFTESIHDCEFADYSRFNDSHSRKVLEVFKCLIKHLLLLSNRKTITRHNLRVLTEVFTKLTLSDNFKCLKLSRFPHYETMISLSKKLQALEKISHKREVSLRLTIKFRAALYAILYGMENNVKDIRIKDIRFSKAS